MSVNEVISSLKVALSSNDDQKIAKYVEEGQKIAWHTITEPLRSEWYELLNKAALRKGPLN